MILFCICELLIFLFMNQNSLIKYMGIVLCFLFCLYKQYFDFIFVIILFADYLLLFTDLYEIGIFLFICVQCLYHHILSHDYRFYFVLLLCIIPTIYSLSLCYAILSLMNIIQAYKQRHWLLITLLLLALCDLLIALQYLMHMNIPFIWYCYLPSQVYYVKMVLSHKIKPLNR